MNSLETIFIQIQSNNEGYNKLLSLLNQSQETDITKGIKCTKKAFNLFESRGNELLAKKDFEKFSVLLLTLRHFATPTLTCFKKFQGFGLHQMISKELILFPMPDPLVTKTIEDLTNTLGVVADFSISMTTSLSIFIPSLLKISSSGFYEPFSLRFEVVRILNEILKHCSVNDKQKLLKECSIIECLVHVGANLHNAGDFELQVSLLEMLSRFTDIAERRQLGSDWFDRINLTRQYLTIREEYFDIDCRYFLNNLNKAFSFNQSVYSLPCQSFKFGSQMLCQPTGMTEFWIDFNSSSNCISLFTENVTLPDKDRMWETVYIKSDEIKGWVISRKGNEWNVNLTLHSSLPIPWMTTPTSNQVVIQFNVDPKNALLKSIGQGKELNILNSSDTQKPHLKASIASIPIRVTSPCLKQQSESIISSVTADDDLSQMIFQLSSQESINTTTPSRRIPLAPKTPHTSTPKVFQPYQEPPPLRKEPMGTAPASSGSIKKITPKLVKQPLSFVGSVNKERKCANNIDSDFAIPKKRSVKDKITTQQPLVSVVKEKKKIISNKSVDLSTGKKQYTRRQSCANSLSDKTFEFPDSPMNRKPVTRKRKKKETIPLPVDTPLLNSVPVETTSYKKTPPTSAAVPVPVTKRTSSAVPVPVMKRTPPTSAAVPVPVTKRTSSAVPVSVTKRTPPTSSAIPVTKTCKDRQNTSTRSSSIKNINHTHILDTNNHTHILDTNNHTHIKDTSNHTHTGDTIDQIHTRDTYNHTHIDETLLAIEPEITNRNQSPIIASFQLEFDKQVQNINPNELDLSSLNDELSCNDNDKDMLQEEVEDVAASQNIVSGNNSANNSIVYDCDESIEKSSLSSFQSSQIEADNGIISEFEQICMSVMNKSVQNETTYKTMLKPPPPLKHKINKSRKQINHCTMPYEEPGLPSASKKPRLAAAVEPPSLPPLGVIHTEVFNSKAPSSPAYSIVATNTLCNNNTNNRGFLFTFENGLNRTVTNGECKMKKVEEHIETAIKVIHEMQNETSAIDELVIQVKELYNTLFVDLNTMCRNEVGETMKKCLSVMDEMKIEREKMLKRAHDREVMNTRKSIQSLIMCLELSEN